MSRLEPLLTLSEAAAELQVTTDDVADPVRWVRDKVRALKLDVVKVGRTPKLPLRTVTALRELITCRYDSGVERMAAPQTGTSWGPSPSGETVAKGIMHYA